MFFFTIYIGFLFFFEGFFYLTYNWIQLRLVMKPSFSREAGKPRSSRSAGKWYQMFYVYILEDLNNRHYIGYSSDLRRRLKEHTNGKTFTTKHMISPKLIYYEAYSSKILAKEREKKLKQFGSSYKGLFKRIRLT